MSYKFDDDYKNCPIDGTCEPQNFGKCYTCSLVHLQDVEIFMLRIFQARYFLKGGSADVKTKDEK